MATSRIILTGTCVGLALVVACLTGCTSTNSAPTTRLQPGTVVATGTLTSWDDSVTGNVTVTVSSKGNFDFRFPNLTTSAKDGLQVILAPRPISLTTQCYPGSLSAFALGSNASRTKPSVLLGDGKLLPFGDPSYFRDAAITQVSAGSPSCETPIWAVAQLNWHIPDPDPALKVYDAGPTGGADGVMVVRDGKPYSYTIVANDLPAEVAARFHLTKAELFYLNPEMGEPDSYEIGEVINLSRNNR